MRLLADENVRGDLVEALRDAGFNVRWILEEHPGMGDGEVLARAVADDRVLITFDKGDFGALVFQKGHPAPGIILFRVSAALPSELVTKVVHALQSRQDWHDHFWTVTDETIRRRRLP